MPDNVLNRPLAEGIRRNGFRKWYERELLSSHAHMILAVLSVIAMMASLEAIGGGSPQEKLTDLLFVAACALIGLWALRRYLFLLNHAEGVANQASCGHCGEYGLLAVHAEDRPRRLVHVGCKRCMNRWTISD